MRYLLLTALLASTATITAVPALAADEERRFPRAEDRGDRGDRSDRPVRTMRRSDDGDSARQRVERPAPAEPPREIQRQVERPEPRRMASDSPAPPQSAPSADPPRGPRRSLESGGPQRAPAAERRAGDSVREWRMRDRYRPDSPSAVEQANSGVAESPPAGPTGSIEERNLRRPERSARGDGAFDRRVRTNPGMTDRPLGRIGRNVPAEGTAPPPPDQASLERGRTTRHWRPDWRHDRRYDWRRHRDRHRSVFRLGFYYDPFGWHYRRYNVGWRLWPSYYSHSYWLSDPWMYRLPPVYGPYRWIRYYDDALLVNIYTGEVVDVIYDFFW